MKADFYVNKTKYNVNLDKSLDLSIPLIFNGIQPNLYNVNIAVSKAYEIGHFIGDTRLGGSCNFEEYTLVPHCNGTHTECVGHISYERIPVHKTLIETFMPAVLISLAPVSSFETKETYDPELNPEDFILTCESLSAELTKVNNDFLKALIIRTLPNIDSKQSMKYIDNPHPFLSLEAMQFIADSGVEHLLVDIPSIDREFDEGKMNNHHIFWNVERGSHETDKNNLSNKTITEMVYIPDEIKDGEYMLNLQIAPFNADASPSRPVLFKLEN